MPTASDMLRALIQAGGTLPQGRFDADWDDAGNFCFLRGLTANDSEGISITEAGRSALVAASQDAGVSP